MGRLSYTRFPRRSYGTTGFRVRSKRFRVQGLRSKLFNFFRMVMKTWKSRLFWTGRMATSCSESSDGSCRRELLAKTRPARLKSFTRTNSFYSEAIADCLEFIKRSSVSYSDDMSDDK
ncbi:hypothetical protein SSX86_019343 [Deinandra increscens subsp. villosa]|uniref:Uncharacterized protein n=1 Tax=Deinandra increscens subsp. villosa TaxID=3103831 RepID=A0AAP0GVM2_9ASTR